MLFFSGENVRKTADENYPFFTNRNFLYLTGVKQEQSALLLQNKDGVISDCLFVLNLILRVRFGLAGVSQRKSSTKSAVLSELRISTT